MAPIFEQHCIRCHQPSNKKAELSLATVADLKSNEYVVAGDPDASYLVEVVTAAAGEKPLMPKEGAQLTAQEVSTLRDWIREGAPWPDGVVVKDRAKADQDWWSLASVGGRRAAVDWNSGEWSRNPIDRFIYARLSVAGLKPNPPADRRTLIRRVSYDLTGLPPTPEETAAFVRVMIRRMRMNSWSIACSRRPAMASNGGGIGSMWFGSAKAPGMRSII